MSARGARVGALEGGESGVGVLVVGDAVGLARSGEASRPGSGSEEHATRQIRQIRVARVAGTAAIRAMPRVNYGGQGLEPKSGATRGTMSAGPRVVPPET